MFSILKVAPITAQNKLSFGWRRIDFSRPGNAAAVCHFSFTLFSFPLGRLSATPSGSCTDVCRAKLSVLIGKNSLECSEGLLQIAAVWYWVNNNRFSVLVPRFMSPRDVNGGLHV